MFELNNRKTAYFTKCLSPICAHSNRNEPPTYPLHVLDHPVLSTLGKRLIGLDGPETTEYIALQSAALFKHPSSGGCSISTSSKKKATASVPTVPTTTKTTAVAAIPAAFVPSTSSSSITIVPPVVSASLPVVPTPIHEPHYYCEQVGVYSAKDVIHKFESGMISSSEDERDYIHEFLYGQDFSYPSPVIPPSTGDDFLNFDDFLQCGFDADDAAAATTTTTSTSTSTTHAPSPVPPDPVPCVEKTAVSPPPTAAAPPSCSNDPHSMGIYIQQLETRLAQLEKNQVFFSEHLGSFMTTIVEQAVESAFKKRPLLQQYSSTSSNKTHRSRATAYDADYESCEETELDCIPWRQPKKTKYVSKKTTSVTSLPVTSLPVTLYPVPVEKTVYYSHTEVDSDLC
jgi:hypothetical protein